MIDDLKRALAHLRIVHAHMEVIISKGTPIPPMIAALYFQQPISTTSYNKIQELVSAIDDEVFWLANHCEEIPEQPTSGDL